MLGVVESWLKGRKARWVNWWRRERRLLAWEMRQQLCYLPPSRLPFPEENWLSPCLLQGRLGQRREWCQASHPQGPSQGGGCGQPGLQEERLTPQNWLLNCSLTLLYWCMNQAKPKFSYRTAPHLSPPCFRRDKTQWGDSWDPPHDRSGKSPRQKEPEKFKQFALLLTIQYWTLSLECSLKETGKNIFFLTDCPWAKKNVNKPKKKLYLQFICHSWGVCFSISLASHAALGENNSD